MSFSQRTIPFMAIVVFAAALAGLASLSWHVGHNPSPNTSRDALRQKKLDDTTTAQRSGINFYDWQNPEKEIVRLPIQRAMDLTVREWTNPAAARSNLLERATRAFSEPESPPSLETTNNVQ